MFLEISQNSQENTCARAFFNNVATLLKKRLWHRCFPVNFAKFLGTPFLQNTSGRLFLTCFVCKRRHSKLKGNVEKSFTTAGYSDWKHALSSFDEHQVASYHRLAMTYEVIVPQCGDVKEAQNESTTSQMELNDIAVNIRNNFYSIICDEYTDISNKEQLSFCIRWVDKFLVAHEEFLGFYEVPNTKIETLVKIIKDILLRFQLSLQLCRGQCFDGASNILGRRSGVAIQIDKEQPKAHYTHCHCHSLNLSIKDVTRSSKMLSDLMDTAGEIFVLIKFSLKRDKLLENLKGQIKNSEQIIPNKITKLSTTR